MKRGTILIGALGGLAVAASFFASDFFGSAKTAKYQKSMGSLNATQSANDYQKWIDSKMIDVETGEVIAPEKLRVIMENHQMQPKNLTVQWTDHGPDNIGGRTRAVHVDYNEPRNVWSGGVTGGLYRSTTRGNLWFRVNNFPGNQFISSIAQDKDGNIYVATGSNNEGSTWTGNGLYVSPDDGETWELVPGTNTIARISRVVSSKFNSEVFFTASSGAPLRKYVYGGSVENVAGYTSVGANTLTMSYDGDVLVVANGANRTFVSTDGGQSFQDKSGNSPGEISTGGVSRIEYAISRKKQDGSYSIYASTVSGGGSSNNAGQWISVNSGDTWHRHTPATGANVGNGVIDFRNQGTWNNVASFDPTNPNRVIIGGIDLHEWVQVINNPPSGSWNQISIWSTHPTSDFYVHADNHALFWDENNRLFIGNDGGIQISDDLGTTFYEANRGFNITQFFKIAVSREGDVIGGTQDNGSLYNNHKNTTYQEHKRATGGDGFSAAISFFNPRVLITSSQYNSMNISTDAGQIFNPLIPDFGVGSGYNPVGTEGAEHPFHTQLFLAEYFDENSEDTILFVPQQYYAQGETVLVPSLSTGDTITYISPIDIRFTDTLNYFPDSTRLEYIVEDEVSGINYDLGIFDFSYFPTATQVYPPLIGDSLLVDGPLGLDTVVVAGFTSYNFYVGVNPFDPTESIDMGRDSVVFNISWDTLRVADPYQSWFVFSTSRNGGELWGTRDALRISNPEPKWVRIADDLGSGAVDVEFSEDLQHMFVVSGGFIGSTENGQQGRVYRIDGLGSVYSTDDDFVEKTSIDHGNTATIKTQIGGSVNQISGIGIDPRNPNILVATQLFGGNVYRSNDATSASPTLTMVGSQGGLAFYDVVVDRDDSDILFAATNNGVSLSEDGGATWTDVSDPTFFGTPAYHIIQSWRTWNEGNKKPGEVYVGTHGRGLWSTDAVLSTVTEEKAPNFKEKKASNLHIYPNPSIDNSTLVVDLKRPGNVNIMFFDLSGSLVKQINMTNMYEGKNEVFFSASDLPQGTYLIRLQSGDQIETAKYIKLL